ncbi:hypothetical protein AD45P4_00320 [Alteromonas phage vB_AmaP_AD45-P4]|nr:hypothetical protein AD45P4_00320 [Alteromonas phage vB_AmaP_AD45-P4]
MKNKNVYDKKSSHDAPITDTEKQVLDLVVKGFSGKEMANKLFVSEATIKFHLNTIRKKKGFTKTSQLIAWYYMGTQRYLESRSPWNIGQELKVVKHDCTPSSQIDGEIVTVARAYPDGIADTKNRLYLNKELKEVDHDRSSTTTEGATV